eukprot:513710-Pelagomonas_calceolata.AAC.1
MNKGTPHAFQRKNKGTPHAFHSLAAQLAGLFQTENKIEKPLRQRISQHQPSRAFHGFRHNNKFHIII